jgi:hypothetical protein
VLQQKATVKPPLERPALVRPPAPLEVRRQMATATATAPLEPPALAPAPLTVRQQMATATAPLERQAPARPEVRQQLATAKARESQIACPVRVRQQSATMAIEQPTRVTVMIE